MAKIFTVHHGLTYRAKLRLSFFEGMASNDMIAEKFHELGFRHITISGSGEHRWAQGVWDGPDESVPLTDEHIESVVEVKTAKMAAAEHAPGDEAPSEEVQPEPDFPPYIEEEEERVEDERLGTSYHGGPKSNFEYNPFNPAYPDANANNNVG